MHRQPSINPWTFKNALFVNNTINATPTGSTNDAVLRFNAAGTATEDDPGTFTETTTAADGTSLAIKKAGIYLFTFTATLTGAVPVFFGISQDVAAAGLVNDPAFATTGFLAIADCLSVASNTAVCSLMATVYVSRALAASATGSVLRCHATNSGNAAPVGIVAGSVQYRVALIGYTGE